MKPRFPLLRVFVQSRFTPFWCVLVAALAAASPVQAQGAGTIEGRVFNAATGNALANARIALQGTTREVLTDEAGAYVLTGVPAGPARLAISYLGFEGQTAAVNVTAGGTATRDFDLAPPGAPRAAGETVKLAEFTVVADREMSAQALAMNEQRYAPNLKNVVAVDEYGDRGDENIGEFLRFLPGVALNDSGHVPNEVTLRGFPANTSTISDRRRRRHGRPRRRHPHRSRSSRCPTEQRVARRGHQGAHARHARERHGRHAQHHQQGRLRVKKRPSVQLSVSQLFHNRSGLTLDGGARTHVDARSARVRRSRRSVSATSIR
jgi:hypothetical protein